MADRKLSAEQIRAIEYTLSRDRRVELIPTRDEIKVVCVRRDQVNVNNVPVPSV